MKFGPYAVEKSEGAILAHSVKVGSSRLRKGMQIDAKAIALLQSAGIAEVTVAHPEIGDVLENEAASLLATRILPEVKGSGIRITTAFTGRVNLIANRPGLLQIDAATVDAINTITPDITLATLPEYTRVSAGDMLATVKIIPYAVTGKVLDSVVAAIAGPVMKLHEFKALRAGLILTQTDAISEKLLEKSRDVTRKRLNALGVSLSSSVTVAHTRDAVAEALGQADEEILLVLGASATSDISDVCPSGVVAAGGQISRFGMPVDPGNLLFLGNIGDTKVIGLPGCARSPAINGADWVLERIICGLDVSSDDIAGMGVGGLLKEISTRPQPRAYDTTNTGGKNVEIILLAAGSSSRMRGEDKLLKQIANVPLIYRTAAAAIGSNATAVHVVLPEDAADRRKALADLNVSIVKARDAVEGMATSLRAGLSAVSDEADAVIIALADMPDVKAGDYDALIDSFNTDVRREICRAISETGKKGHPVLFGRRFFESLSDLTGDQGAREIIQSSQEFVVDVPTSGQGATIDLDTQEAWAAYLGQGSSPEK